MAESTYLERRIEFLAQIAKEGKLHFPSKTPSGDDFSDLLQDLEKVRRKADGRVDLKTCSPQVRSFARAIYMMKDVLEEDERRGTDERPAATDHAFDLMALQRRLFEILQTFVEEMTGKRLETLHSEDEVTEAAKSNLLKNNVDSARVESLLADYLRLSGSHFVDTFSSSQGLGGLKTVLGGSQRFPKAALKAVRSMLLYADTILVPDPVLPWLEVERREETFAHVLMLRQAYTLLTLKPLIDADLPYPAVLVFPSFEKRLELSESQTQDGLARLYLEFFSWFFNATFEDESEIVEAAGTNPEEFLRKVEEHRLFVAPGGSPGTELSKAIELYRSEIRRWRSAEYQRRALSQPESVLVLNGIMERLIPQFHLRDNADSLAGQPMVWHEAHWHYFGLCAEASEGQLVKRELLSSTSVAALRGLISENLRWLGAVPLPALVELRRRNENERFRNRLSEFTDQLSSSRLDELDRSVAELKRGLASLLAEHQEEVRLIQAKYEPKYEALAAGSWLTLGAQFLPWLAPFLGPVFPAAAGTTYLAIKLQEQAEHREVSRSLTGILAAAHSMGAEQADE